MPGLYKIGYTSNDVDSRVKQLSKATGIPTDFECIYQAQFGIYAAPHTVEQMTHKKLDTRRVSGKEFFRFDSDDQAIQHLCFALTSCCRDLLSSDSGQNWINNNTTEPHGDTEWMHMDMMQITSNVKPNAEFEAMIIQSDMSVNGDIEELSIFLEIGLLDVVRGAIMLKSLGYAKNIYDGIYMYMEKSTFFDSWLHEMSKSLMQWHRNNPRKKETIQ